MVDKPRTRQITSHRMQPAEQALARAISRAYQEWVEESGGGGSIANFSAAGVLAVVVLLEEFGIPSDADIEQAKEGLRKLAEALDSAQPMR